MHMTETTFSHQKANSPDAHYSDGGLRSFFVYRDTGVNAATKGKVRVQLVRAAHRSSEAKGGTGFHFHTADVHVVYMVRGWAVCHERRMSCVRRATVREMKEGPSSSVIRSRSQATASCCGQKRWW